MSLANVSTIIGKQLKDALRNKECLIQFILMPIMALVMQNAVQVDDMPKNYFVTMFASMYVGMAPLSVAASIISEEKEKNTLRVLLMHNVKPMEYLLGVGTFILGMCMLGSIAFAAEAGYTGVALLSFLLSMAVGIILSTIIGALVGILCKSQMMATSVSVPVMIVLSFLPMLSMFNDSVKKISGLIYTGQVYDMINKVQDFSLSYENVIVLAASAVITVGLFVFSYKRSNLV